MKTFSYADVELTSGYLFNKQELNRNTAINAVYDRFNETGRIGVFNFDYKAGDPITPHIFWDSDVAKWMEGACYILKKHKDSALLAKVESLVEKIKEHQDENGYFNTYFTVCEPENRFTDRARHELYCAGHLMEASIAYSEATGRDDFLACMEKYADHIEKVFVIDKSAPFISSGHEEIDIALIRMYVHTGKKKFLRLAEHFINVRGTEGDAMSAYDQSHLPVREQSEAVGHAVRVTYLCTAMARLAYHTGDKELITACHRLWNNITKEKMYITGGVGTTCIGESFSVAYDLPNDTAYTETCASVGLMFFANAMLALENNAEYADITEQVLYNGVLSAISLDGESFFYENPLEVNLLEQAEFPLGKRRFPMTHRFRSFGCACCPPNLNRLFATLGSYVYGFEKDTLFINQYVSSVLDSGDIRARINTEYPKCGNVRISASGVDKIAVRVPAWCEKFTVNKPYRMENGYAVVENDGEELVIDFTLAVRAVYADARVFRDARKIAFMRGPVVYCAEAKDNDFGLHSYFVSPNAEIEEAYNEEYGLVTLSVKAKRLVPFENALYSSKAPAEADASLQLIPYSCFANRGENDMLVWFNT